MEAKDLTLQELVYKLADAKARCNYTYTEIKELENELQRRYKNGELSKGEEQCKNK